MAQTPEIGQGLGRFFKAVERVNKNRLRWTNYYWGLRTTTLFHDILILPYSCQQVKEDNLPPHWVSNQRTSVCEANGLPLTPQQTAQRSSFF